MQLYFQANVRNSFAHSVTLGPNSSFLEQMKSYTTVYASFGLLPNTRLIIVLQIKTIELYYNGTNICISVNGIWKKRRPFTKDKQWNCTSTIKGHNSVSGFYCVLAFLLACPDTILPLSCNRVLLEAGYVSHSVWIVVYLSFRHMPPYAGSSHLQFFWKILHNNHITLF